MIANGGDGAYLFYSLPHVFVIMSRIYKIGTAFVEYVSDDWWRLKPFTMNREFAPYSTKSQYITNHKINGTF